MASNHVSREAEDKPNSFEARRKAEIEAGRKKVQERAEALMQAGRVDGRQMSRALRDGDKQLEEDERRRAELLDTAKTFTQREADRAGAEVIDQAQTELEAVQHIADNNEPILDFRRERIIERLEADADPQAAQEVTTDIVTAQAVNQPTVLANERGVETEGKVLNATQGIGGNNIPDENLALYKQEVPEDKHVPKTRKKAERVAKQKVPKAEKVVKEQAVVTQDEPEKNEAVEIVRQAPDEALGE